MKSLSIRQKLTFSYVILIIVTVLTIGAIISIIFSGQLTESSKKQLNLRIEKISKEIEDQLLMVMKITEEISENQEILHNMNLVDNNKKTLFLNDIRTAISSTENRSPLIERIILINHNLEILDPVYKRSLYSSAILGDDDFIEFLSKKYFYYFAKPGTFPIDIENKKNTALTIAVYQRLLDNNYWLMGYQISVINKQMLFSSIWNSNRDQIFSGINIFNERNELLFNNGMSFPSEKINQSLDYSRFSGNISVDAYVNSKKCLVLIKLLPTVNWFVTGVIPYSTIFKNLNIALRLVTFIGILFTIITGLISYSIARTITKPLIKLTTAMHSYEKTGTLIKTDFMASGELQYLLDVYNKLVSQINEFIKSIYEEQEEKRNAELKSLQYELDYLQAQINPHFIHNTLNAIGYQAEKNGDTHVFESLKSFNILLRAAISGTEELITIKQELNLIEHFIKIQRLRYGNTFSVVYEVSEDILQDMVPKLILQPLVENALFHGIVPSANSGKITIRIHKNKINLFLEVSDNGVGMDDIQLHNNKSFNKIGLQNIEERIKILFGSSYGLSLKSIRGKGTNVILTIPSGE